MGLHGHHPEFLTLPSRGSHWVPGVRGSQPIQLGAGLFPGLGFYTLDTGSTGMHGEPQHSSPGDMFTSARSCLFKGC